MHFTKSVKTSIINNFKEVDDENANVPMVEKRSELEVKMKIKNVSLKAEILLRQQPGRAGPGDILQFYYERERERDLLSLSQTLLWRHHEAGLPSHHHPRPLHQLATRYHSYSLLFYYNVSWT